MSSPVGSFNLIYIQDVPLPTISFDDLQHVCNQGDLSEASSTIMEAQKDDNYHSSDSQMYDGMEEDRPGIEQGGEEDGIDEGEEEGDSMDEYIPSGSGPGRGRGGRRGHGGGIGHGAGFVQNHNWHPGCRRGSGRLNLISGEVAGSRQYALDDEDAIDADEEFNGLVNQAREEGNLIENPDLSPSESQVLSDQARCVLLKLSKSCKAILSDSSKYYTDASQILDMLVGESPAWSANTAFADNSMEAVASRCRQADRLVSCAKFINALALIHFRTKVER